MKPPVGAKRRPVHLAFALVPGFLDASLGVTTAIVQTTNALCRAAGVREALRLSFVAPGRGAVVSAAGLNVAHEAMAVAATADWLVMPGAFLEGAQAIRDWVTQPAMAPWLDMLRGRQSAARPVAASCAGTWALAESGILDARQATTVWWLAPAFRAHYPAVLLDLQRMVVSDGSLVTAGAALAHTDLMLHLLARMVDATMAERCAGLLLADRREVQSRHISLSWMADADPLMRRACAWIDRHLDDPFDLADLSRALNITPRTLARRCQRALGVSPWTLVQRRRIEAAAQLLRGTTLPFEKIAARVGYADASALRTLIKREMGVPPSSLRTVAS